MIEKNLLPLALAFILAILVLYTAVGGLKSERVTLTGSGGRQITCVWRALVGVTCDFGK